MADLRIAGVRDAETAIDDAAVEALQARLRGPLIRPADDRYEEARKLWNGMIDKRPGLIVKATGVADGLAAVKFARERELALAIRGGSHSAAGLASCDGGLVIDLSLMKGV